MQSPHFMQGPSEPIDPIETVHNGIGNENDRSVLNNTINKNDGGRGDSGEEQDGEENDDPMQKGPVDSADRTAHHRQQQQQKEEEEQQQQQNGGFSGVRKILHPGEALDSARHTAELIMKDAMDALMRTKQRLMEILPSLTPSHSADPSKEVENVKKNNFVGKGEGGGIRSDETRSGEEKGSQCLTSNESRGIYSNPTLGILDQSSSDFRQSITKAIVAARL